MKVFMVHYNIAPDKKIHNIHHGIAFLVGSVKAAGHEVDFFQIHLESEYDEMVKRMKAFAPDVVGISLVTNQMVFFRRSIAKIKETGAKVIVGGIHPTIEKEDTLKIDGVDAICIGEAEITFVQYLNKLQAGLNVHDTPGFMFKAVDGSIIKGPSACLEPDINKLPLPDYSIYGTQEGSCAETLLIRGCPYNCTYCVNWNLRSLYTNKESYIRYPTVEKAIAQVKYTLKYYPNVKSMFFEDDLFTTNRKWLEEFCEVYKREIGLPFGINIRIEACKEKTLDILAEAGCTRVNFGIESGNDWVRRNLLDRKYKNSQVFEAAQKLRERGITFFTYNMMGLPFETEEQIRDTININYAINADAGGVFYFYPYPGTQLLKVCEQFDLLTEEAKELPGYCQDVAIKLTHIKKKKILALYNELNTFFLARFIIQEKVPVLKKIDCLALSKFIAFILRSQGMKNFFRFLKRSLLPANG